MSLWVCAEHGLYGGQVFCPVCGVNGDYATVEPAEEREGDASDEAALPPSGLSRDASQAKPAAAIARSGE